MIFSDRRWIRTKAESCSIPVTSPTSVLYFPSRTRTRSAARMSADTLARSWLRHSSILLLGMVLSVRILWGPVRTETTEAT